VLQDTETPRAPPRRSSTRSGNAAQRALALPLQGVIDQFDRLPTRKETQIAIKLVARGATSKRSSRRSGSASAEGERRQPGRQRA
jgi:hypothetical protein